MNQSAWTHNKAAMFSLPRRKLSTRQPGTATPLFYNNLRRQWALSSDERTGGVAALGGGDEGLELGGENRTRGWQCCSECVSFFGAEREGAAEGQSKGLCVWHFECRLCYTVHGSPRVQRDRVIYFVDIMNVGFVFGSSRTRMFSLIPPHRGWAVGFYFGHMETMGLITLQ